MLGGAKAFKDKDVDAEYCCVGLLILWFLVEPLFKRLQHLVNKLPSQWRILMLHSLCIRLNLL